MAHELVAFEFGKNWQRYLRTINRVRVGQAISSLSEALSLADLQGKSFVDVGCGSGLFSLSAFKLGASPVVSFDVDPFSVQCCNYLRDATNRPASWHVKKGSILDMDFVSRLGKFDVVYSYGVLHHTGSMWKAIANTTSLVTEGGLLYLALYNRIDGRFGSDFWRKVKRTFNNTSPAGRQLLFLLYVYYFFGVNTAQSRNPWRIVHDYYNRRGMNWWTDAIDWLGGYPYEFATVNEIQTFMAREFPNFKLRRHSESRWLGNNEFLFEKLGRESHTSN